MMSRSDLARKEFERAHKSTWATDDLLLQHIEAVIGLVTGKDSYSNPYSYFNEQLQNPSLINSNGQSLLARGVVNLLKGQYQSAVSDFEEANKNDTKADGLIGAMIASNLIKEKRSESRAIWE
jgi:coatomer subunit epsilon